MRKDEEKTAREKENSKVPDTVKEGYGTSEKRERERDEQPGSQTYRERGERRKAELIKQWHPYLM